MKFEAYEKNAMHDWDLKPEHSGWKRDTTCKNESQNLRKTEMASANLLMKWHRKMMLQPFECLQNNQTCIPSMITMAVKTKK